ALGRLPVHPLDQRAAVDVRERLAGQPRRGVARRDDRDELDAHERTPSRILSNSASSRSACPGASSTSTGTHHRFGCAIAPHLTASFSVISTGSPSSKLKSSAPITA